MIHDWYYKYLDVPSPPKWMILAAVHHMKSRLIVPEDNSYTIQHKNIHEVPGVTAWVDQNLPRGYTSIDATWSTAGLDNLRVHTDRGRDYGMFYLLDTGGDNVVTTFYREKDHPIVRDRTVTVYDYDRLDVLDSVVFEKHRWIMLYNRVLHNAANITRNRLYIQLSYDSIDTVRQWI